MKKIFLLLSMYAAGESKAQRVVMHTDLLPQTFANSAYKIGLNKVYENKLDEVARNREKTAAYTATIEEVQRKVFNSLTNVEGAIRNGKTLLYISKKIPLIFDNLAEASKLAAGKPYLVTIAGDQSRVMVERVVKLQAYLQDFVLKEDAKILISPTDRDKFIHEVYTNINIIYSMSGALINTFKMHNLQDAVDKVIPYRMYVNMDKIIIQDIARKLKF